MQWLCAILLKHAVHKGRKETVDGKWEILRTHAYNPKVKSDFKNYLYQFSFLCALLNILYGIQINIISSQVLIFTSKNIKRLQKCIKGASKMYQRSRALLCCGYTVCSNCPMHTGHNISVTPLNCLVQWKQVSTFTNE